MIDRINTFLIWFGDGLLAAVPVRWQQAYRWPRRWLLVVGEADGFCCTLHERRGPGVSFRLPRSAGAESAEKAIPAGVLRLMQTDGLPIVLRLPLDAVLHRRLTFPATVMKDLGRVVRFEIDRQTPFRAEDVYAGYAVDAEASTGERLYVTLSTIRRPALDAILDPLRKMGLRVSVVDVEGLHAAETGMNLLGDETQARQSSPLLLRAGLALIFLLCVLALPLNQKRQIEAEIDRLAEVERARRAEVALVHKLREQTSAMVRSSTFLHERESAHVNAVEVLEEATRIMPDHSWVHRFEIKNGQLNLQGESREAAAIPALFEASAVFADPHFSAPLTRNAVTGAERFRLSARIVSEVSG